MRQPKVSLSRKPASPLIGNRALFLPALAAIALASGCDGDGAIAQTIAGPPAVSATSPDNGAIEVPTGSVVSAEFQQPIDPSTLTTTTFTLQCPAGTDIPGTISYDAANRRAIFTPASALPGDVVCAARVSADVKSPLGVRLASGVM